ncbi:MAG TPA: hypothetical protein VF666_13220 [Pyrinomonadaceae bacterium]|jgi:hypothetical protein
MLRARALYGKRRDMPERLHTLAMSPPKPQMAMVGLWPNIESNQSANACTTKRLSFGFIL